MSPLPSTAMLGLGATPSFLGFVDRGQFLPDLVILHGPHGSGSFSSYRLYSYDTKSGGWTNRLILRSSGTSEFSYDEKTSTLRYRTVIGGQWRKFILGDRTYVICGSSSPLRLKLSPIRGATYTKDKAPVSITFENTGDKAILIRHQRPYLSAFLYIELRQKDGTLVSQRPKEGLVSHNDKPRYVTVKRNKPYSFIVDVAKLRKVLMDGEYTLSVQYSSETETRGFVGLVRSNTMNIRIGN